MRLGPPPRLAYLRTFSLFLCNVDTDAHGQGTGLYRTRFGLAVRSRNGETYFSGRDELRIRRQYAETRHLSAEGGRALVFQASLAPEGCGRSGSAISMEKSATVDI